MSKDYKEMYAAYGYAKHLEKGTYKELENELQRYNDLIIERDSEREIAANKRLRISWSIMTLLSFFGLIVVFHIKELTDFLFLLFICGMWNAFVTFVLLPGIHDLIYSKNIEDAHNLEELKFQWLVIKKELERRDSEEANQILAELEDECK